MNEHKTLPNDHKVRGKSSKAKVSPKGHNQDQTFSDLNNSLSLYHNAKCMLHQLLIMLRLGDIMFSGFSLAPSLKDEGLNAGRIYGIILGTGRRTDSISKLI